MQSIRWLLLHPVAVVWPAVAFAITLLIALGVRQLMLRALRIWTERRKSRPGLILSDALGGPTTLIWAVIAAAHLGMQASALPPRWEHYEPRILTGLWIVSLTILCAGLAGNLVRYYGAQAPNALPVTTLTETLGQIAV